MIGAVLIAKRVSALFLSLFLTVPTASGIPRLQPDRPIACEACDSWNAARKPFRVFGNTYFAGVAGLSSVLIASDNVLILLDGDPQFGFGREANAFPRVHPVRVVADGETLRDGDPAITAHCTPGHTPASTTWTWRSCKESRCLDIVYADSLNPVPAPGFRFTDHAGRHG